MATASLSPARGDYVEQTIAAFFQAAARQISLFFANWGLTHIVVFDRCMAHRDCLRHLLQIACAGRKTVLRLNQYFFKANRRNAVPAARRKDIHSSGVTSIAYLQSRVLATLARTSSRSGRKSVRHIIASLLLAFLDEAMPPPSSVVLQSFDAGCAEELSAASARRCCSRFARVVRVSHQLSPGCLRATPVVGRCAKFLSLRLPRVGTSYQDAQILNDPLICSASHACWRPSAGWRCQTRLLPVNKIGFPKRQQPLSLLTTHASVDQG